jgi:hypothetical protein
VVIQSSGEEKVVCGPTRAPLIESAAVPEAEQAISPDTK